MSTTTLKHIIINALIITGLALLSTTASYAQEGELDYLNPDLYLNEIYEIPETPIREEVVIKSEKESIPSVKPNVTKAKKKVTDNQDNSKTSSGPNVGYQSDRKEVESVLSFNFLYYMIQKYKFTDVVDQ